MRVNKAITADNTCKMCACIVTEHTAYKRAIMNTTLKVYLQRSSQNLEWVPSNFRKYRNPYSQHPAVELQAQYITSV